MIYLNLAIIILLLLALVKSATLIQNSLLTISQRLRISPFVTGFVLLSIASSLPEISVAINASAQDIPELSVGNLFGATVFLLTISIGILAIKRKSISFDDSFEAKEVVISSLLILTEIFVVLDGRLDFIEGLALIVLYLIFALYLIFKTKKTISIKDEINEIRQKDFAISIAKTLVGIIVLVVISNIIVRLSGSIAAEIGIPEMIIGLALLGVGTNLPELAIMLSSRSENSNKLAIGNIIGSATANVLTLGLLGIMLPHKIDDIHLLLPVGIALMLACLLFTFFSHTGRVLTRREGFTLVSIYILLVVYEFFNTSL